MNKLATIPQSIPDLIMAQEPAIARVIHGATPEEKIVNAQRFARIALSAVRKNPALTECTPASFAASLMACAELNLEPNTPQNLAYLIPYKRECTFMPGYMGLMELAYRTGNISTFHADVVYRKEVENGMFIYHKGLCPDIVHTIDLLSDYRSGGNSDIIAAYAVAVLKDGNRAFRLIDRNEIERARQKSAKKTAGPWENEYAAMAMKTVIKRLCSWLRKTPELARAIDIDDRLERNEDDGVTPTGADIVNSIINSDQIINESRRKCPHDGVMYTPYHCSKCPERPGCPAWGDE